MPHLPLSKRQLDKLGDRLRDTADPPRIDFELLELVLASYEECLHVVVAILRNIGVEPTTRIKTSNTIVDKLRRDRGFSLKSIQDLAGARVVLDGDLDEQDETVRTFCDSFASERRPSIIDRRSDPRSGYRAVHVVPKVDGIPVEVQFRTGLQDEWALVFEKVAKNWGRQIRYGQDPDVDPRSKVLTARRRNVVRELISVSDQIGSLEDLIAGERTAFLRRAAASQGFAQASQNGIVPADMREVRSAFRKAVEEWRQAVALIRQALRRLADAVEKEDEPN